ncbi:MAG: D-2-hydroxyacid dehydrogenase [Planctomycetes bacterium]|nr:D-2-hydroxyacid dehydrogenase [Planctomycetota bacterium]
MRIVLCYPVEPKHLAQIAAVAPQAELVDAGQEGVAREILEADIYCGHAKVHPIPWGQVVERGRLRWIQSSAAGTDHCLTREVIESDIPVTSASGVLADQVAEHTLALMTGLSRNLPVFFHQQQAKMFVRQPTRDVHHGTVGIVGFGGNGRRIAEVLRPLRVRIVATDYYPVGKPDYVERLLPPEGLDELLPEIDFLVLAAPLNAHTRGMINADTFARLKPGAFLINMARGKLVVEDDLVAALESRRLEGAGLDVTWDEPLPESSRLWDQPTVIITPHVGGQAATRIDDMTNFFCENLRRYQAGEPLLNLLVDKRLGFPPPRMG